MSVKKQECFKYSNRDKMEEIKKTISWAKNTLSRIQNRKSLIFMIVLSCYHFKIVCHNQKMVLVSFMVTIKQKYATEK